MNLEQRINLLVRLGQTLAGGDPGWTAAKKRAAAENGWFRPEFIDLAVEQIVQEFLQRDKLTAWAEKYQLPMEKEGPGNIGLVMAGNIPLVGFHDFLTIFLSGHRQTIKPSSKDNVLIRYVAEQLVGQDPVAGDFIGFADRLKGCDAFIATGSNNSARYFDYYFSKYPHIIRRNRSSVALLSGGESPEELSALADDVYLYFGLGCRNVTKIYTPENYDFIPLLEAFRKYNYLSDYNKYKNNYDYYLTLLILNKKLYMTNGSILLEENPGLFSPISVLHYEQYRQEPGALSLLAANLAGNPDNQCIVGRDYTPFGNAQRPSLHDYADGVDTMQFILSLPRFVS